MDTDDLPEVNEIIRDILFTSCFIDIFPGVKHRLSDNMRHELFIHVYFALNLVVFHSALQFELRCLYKDLSRHIKGVIMTFIF